MRLLDVIVCCAFSAVFLTCLIRQPKLVRGLVEREIKPFSCDLCMSFWCSLIGCLSVWYLAKIDEALIAMALPASTGLAWTALKLSGHAIEAPPLPVGDDDATTASKTT